MATQTGNTVAVRFVVERHGTSLVSVANGEVLYRFSPSTRRGDTTAHAQALLPGAHDFSKDRGDQYGASMDAVKQQALTDLRDWFKVTFGLDVAVVNETKEG